MEKWKSGKLEPIKKRATHIHTIPEERDKDPRIKFADEVAEYVDAKPEGDWTPEQVEDYFDAMAGLNDQLVQAKGWWVLEAWPIKVKIQREGEDEWEKKVSINKGRYRPVQDLEPKVHWTVRQKMRDQGYKMRTRVDRNAVWTTVV